MATNGRGKSPPLPAMERPPFSFIKKAWEELLGCSDEGLSLSFARKGIDGHGDRDGEFKKCRVSDDSIRFLVQQDKLDRKRRTLIRKEERERKVQELDEASF